MNMNTVLRTLCTPYTLQCTHYNVHAVHCTTYIVRRTSGVYCRVLRRWLWFTILYINNQWPQTINAYNYIRTLPALTIILHPTYVYLKCLHLYQNTPPPTPSHKPSQLFYTLHMYTLNAYTYIRSHPSTPIHKPSQLFYTTICIPKTPTPISITIILLPPVSAHLKHPHHYQNPQLALTCSHTPTCLSIPLPTFINTQTTILI